MTAYTEWSSEAFGGSILTMDVRFCWVRKNASGEIVALVDTDSSDGVVDWWVTVGGLKRIATAGSVQAARDSADEILRRVVVLR